MNKKIMRFIDSQFHTELGAVKIYLDAVESPLDYDYAMQYRRKHEWALWGYMDAVMDFTDVSYDDMRKIKSYYRKRFKSLFDKYFV